MCTRICGRRGAESVFLFKQPVVHHVAQPLDRHERIMVALHIALQPSLSAYLPVCPPGGRCCIVPVVRTPRAVRRLAREGIVALFLVVIRQYFTDLR